MTIYLVEKIAAVYGVHLAVILYPEGYSSVSSEYSKILKKANRLREDKEALSHITWNSLEKRLHSVVYRTWAIQVEDRV